LCLKGQSTFETLANGFDDAETIQQLADVRYLKLGGTIILSTPVTERYLALQGERKKRYNVYMEAIMMIWGMILVERFPALRELELQRRAFSDAGNLAGIIDDEFRTARPDIVLSVNWVD